MNDDDRDDLVSEAADAVAWNEEVDWDRCARRAAPARRRMLDNLRALGLNDLTGEIPTEIGDLDSLQWLELGLNGLTGAIPTEIGCYLLLAQ